MEVGTILINMRREQLNSSVFHWDERRENVDETEHKGERDG